MNLEFVAPNYNDLSDKLRKEISDKVSGFGKVVRYKFDISSPNPDPSKYNGDTIWPTKYTLDPAVFTILDPYEDRPGKSKSKRIALVDGVDPEKGHANRFKKIRVESARKGVLPLDLTNQDDFYMAMFLELHPKLNGGKFADKNARKLISRIDEQAEATTQRTERSQKLKALNAVSAMSDKDLVDFADAMGWDSSDDKVILRNNAEDLAEHSPEFFNDLIAGQSVEYKSAVQQALNKKVISFDPVEGKFTWTSNTQTITLVSPGGDHTAVDKLAEWLQSGGVKAEEVYKKIKALIGVKNVDLVVDGVK